ncbi:Glyoxalase-like domain [Listeria grayi]|uniref:Glyoxalase family protein n=3 Tax=Listeria grayi TaxID=1641 RepID=D7UYC3_LISGR|nr:VOC family protein [Listeria grayi]EFI83910.1 glyoxalase family protein [Listeria grayi DSM 20601]EUJ25927.1 glyoxalase/bleomycin resistance protein/dioxygenase [Listeria grayi FSL F6-1183]MBC1923055.1 VOC family protein [Listeria grayi]STY44234.1 Glyoxalase-like domain [Listeria grayi]VEI36001.1 Glyoxalase-like domain [Listeria grayi]
MKLQATRIITDDVDVLIRFYEKITELKAVRLHPLFAELRTNAGVLAIASSKTVPLLGDNAAEAGANRSVMLDFLVADVDAEYERLKKVISSFVNAPTDMPWGNRSLLFRDPDGNLINFFTPATAEE